MFDVPDQPFAMAEGEPVRQSFSMGAPLPSLPFFTTLLPRQTRAQAGKFGFELPGGGVVTFTVIYGIVLFVKTIPWEYPPADPRLRVAPDYRLRLLPQ